MPTPPPPRHHEPRFSRFYAGVMNFWQNLMLVSPWKVDPLPHLPPLRILDPPIYTVFVYLWIKETDKVFVSETFPNYRSVFLVHLRVRLSGHGKIVLTNWNKDKKNEK